MKYDINQMAASELFSENDHFDVIFNDFFLHLGHNLADVGFYVLIYSNLSAWTRLLT